MNNVGFNLMDPWRFEHNLMKEKNGLACGYEEFKENCC
jgi:hypothetical protein